MIISIFKKLLVLVLLLVAFNVNALPNRLIDDVAIKKENGFDVITIKFSVPLHYSHHFPKTESRTVIISLRAFNNDAKIVLTSSDKEKYRIPRKRSKLVSYLRVESLDNNVGKIAVQFKKKLKFSVKQVDKRTLKIILGKSNASKKLAKPKKKATKSSAAKKTTAKKSKSKKRKKSTKNTKITYVLNLESYQKGKKPRKIPKLDVFKKYKLFRTRVKKNGTLITRLRLGFFRSKTEATRIKRRLKVYYPNTFVTLIQKNESSLANKWFAKKKIKPIKKTKVAKKKPAKKLTKKQISKVDRLFDKGKVALVEKKYRNAISYFTKVSEIGSGEKKQRSMEYVGLAREKNGQIAHAKAEYKKYLKIYTEGIGPDRVKQRLEGLLTAQLAPKKKLVDTREQAREEEPWDIFSTISQNYRNQKTIPDGSVASTTDNSVSSYFNTSGRKRGEKYDLRYQFDMDHRYDFTENASQESRFGLSTAYFDYISLTGGGIVRVGRQSRSSGGVLGRYDGVWYGYPLTNDVKLNVVAGFPVISSGVNFNSDEQVLGLSADFDRVFKSFDMSTFVIQQTNDGMLDRRAIGTELRYIQERSSYFGLLDYDIEYSTLNTIQFVGNWLFKNNTSFNFVYDHRASPIMLTTNGLIGTGKGDLKELQSILTDAEIRELALARTGVYDSVSISGNFPLDKTYSLSADFNASKSGGTPATTTPALINPPDNLTGTINATAPLGPDYYFGVTLIGQNLFSPRDTNIVSLRQSTGTSKSTAIDVRSQFNLTKKWRMRPRVRYDTRTRSTNTTKTNRITASTRFDFRYRRELQFQFEIGVDFSNTTDAGITTNDTDYAIDLSYIYDF
ncbi:MAG: tol-pal system YbgF family protein [Gammaproteobacteria bacterium]